MHSLARLRKEIFGEDLDRVDRITTPEKFHCGNPTVMSADENHTIFGEMIRVSELGLDVDESTLKHIAARVAECSGVEFKVRLPIYYYLHALP